MTPVSDTRAMIAGMAPVLYDGAFTFVSNPDPEILSALLARALAVFQEEEGPSLVIPVESATAHGIPTDMPMRRITLEVHSSLAGIGLTAAVATRLTECGIPCNMIAAALHDHVFVPADRAEEALAALRDLQQSHATS